MRQSDQHATAVPFPRAIPLVRVARPDIGELRAWLTRSRYWLIPCALLYAWLTFLAFVLPYDPDEAVYAIVSRGILHGEWPYRDLWVNRQPLIFLWYLPVTFGANLQTERLLAAFMIVASIPVFSRLARGWLSGRPHAIAVCCYALFLANPFMIVGANTEAFLLVPLLAAFIAPTALVAGLLFGVALMTKLTVLPFIPLLVLRWKRSTPLVIAGIAVVTILASLPFVPVWHDFWVANVGFNGSFGEYTLGRRLADLVWMEPGALVGSFPLWVAAILGLTKLRSGVLWLAAGCAYVAAKITGFDVGHYYALVVPVAAITAALCVEHLWSRRSAALLGLLAAAAVPALFIATEVMPLVGHPANPGAVAEMRAHPGELYVLGGRPQLYVYDGRQPIRRFFFGVPLEMRSDWGAQTRQALLDCLPDVVAIPDWSMFAPSWAPDLLAHYGTRVWADHTTIYSHPDRGCTR